MKVGRIFDLFGYSSKDHQNHHDFISNFILRSLQVEFFILYPINYYENSLIIVLGFTLRIDQ